MDGSAFLIPKQAELLRRAKQPIKQKLYKKKFKNLEKKMVKSILVE